MQETLKQIKDSLVTANGYLFLIKGQTSKGNRFANLDAIQANAEKAQEALRSINNKLKELTNE